jgi:hypothetical protein
MPITKEALKTWLTSPAPASDLAEQIRRSPATPLMRSVLQKAAPDLTALAPTTYTLYREFEHTGAREGYQKVYYARRSQLTRAVLELLLGDEGMRDTVHDLLWQICEETTWVLPAHEEQGPGYWDLDPPSARERPLGAHTMLTREPDSIDLFAAETGASLAEAVALLGDRIAPEVALRVRQEVERHIFRPYLAHGRDHWWYKGALNWNGVCNGAIGLAFMRLERDPETLAEAIAQALEGFEAYIATGFEPDGGSVEGVGYWNYGLMYYVTLGELLRERSGGALDLLGQERLKAIARYPALMSLSPGRYLNPGDASEELAIAPGIAQRLAERTGVPELIGLLGASDQIDRFGVLSAKLAIMLRNCAWWDGRVETFPAPVDAYLPDCGAIKLVGEAADGRPVALAAIAGHNDGHHSHTDVGSFVYHRAGESLLCDPGPGRYSKEYFRQQRYENIFNNAIGHSVPRIGGRLQAPGPEFGGRRQFHGAIVEHGEREGMKRAVIELQRAYDLPELTLARRTLTLNPRSGAALLEDEFAFAGPPLPIEEAFITWGAVETDGPTARIGGASGAITLHVEEPSGASFRAARLEAESEANRKPQALTRITLALPEGATRARIRIEPS